MFPLSTQLFPKAPKKKLANGFVGSPVPPPSALRSQIDECLIGSWKPTSNVPSTCGKNPPAGAVVALQLRSGGTVEGTQLGSGVYVPDRKSCACCPFSSSTRPSDARALSNWNLAKRVASFDD